ncbi:Bro-N domain-containing protein [Metabacillus idriensis]|uniref:BRO-N domain-containing protein n=1 Tax=Metabacillus idriensis TaxID=324768 RepID=UPI00203B6953|nr:Bro-N domain-containing protein [Metabacillus idriensis]
MNELQRLFDFQGQQLRMVIHNDDPWFVAKDVCDILEIKNVTQAIQRLDEDERSMFNIGRQGNVNIVNESGLYELIFASRKLEAKMFKK